MASGERRSAGQASSPPGARLTFSANRVWRVTLITCLALEIVFVLLDYHVNYGRLTEIGALRRMTNIAREDGLASWFGTTQTLLVALTAWVIVLVVRAQQAAPWRLAGWTMAALLFTFMAVDDGAQLHERFGTVAQVVTEDANLAVLAFFPSYTWQVVFGPVFATVGLLMAVFLWRELQDRVSLALVGGAFCCLGVAVGLDFFEGLGENHPWNAYTMLTARFDLDTWATRSFRSVRLPGTGPLRAVVRGVSRDGRDDPVLGGVSAFGRGGDTGDPGALDRVTRTQTDIPLGRTPACVSVTPCRDRCGILSAECEIVQGVTAGAGRA